MPKETVIPEWGPNQCHKGAIVGRQSLDLGAYGNFSCVSPMAGNDAPSDINPLADYVQGAICVWKKEKKNIHMLLGLWYGGCSGWCGNWRGRLCESLFYDNRLFFINIFVFINIVLVLGYPPHYEYQSNEI